MKRILPLLLTILLLIPAAGCSAENDRAQIVATTKPVYDLTTALCADTGVHTELLVTQSLSCLHDYTLQVWQMQAIESAQAVIISGAGMEDFMQDILMDKEIIDSSQGVRLICPQAEDDHSDHDHDPHGHSHTHDPHIWLSPQNGRIMADNICRELIRLYPEHQQVFLSNQQTLNERFDELEQYAQQQLSTLSCRELITFHNGFAYFAQYCDLTILHSLEEEAGSEASAQTLKALIETVRQHRLPAIFTEANGSSAAAETVARETGIGIFCLNMGMSELDYFETIYHNIDTVKEALE